MKVIREYWISEIESVQLIKCAGAWIVAQRDHLEECYVITYSASTSRESAEFAYASVKDDYRFGSEEVYEE